MPALHPNNLFLVQINAFVLLVLVAGGLATCLLGYPLFRVLLTAFGLVAGIAGGMDLVDLLRGDSAATFDFVVACAALGCLGGLLAWFACRVAFSLGAAWLVASQVAALVGVIVDSPGSPVVWIIGLLIGLATGVIAYGYMRSAVIITSAVVGAALAVYAITLLLFGERSGPDLMDSTFGQGRPWVAWFLVLLAVALAAGGMWLQAQLADAVGDRFMPRTRRRKRRGRNDRRNDRGGTEVRPKFTHV